MKKRKTVLQLFDKNKMLLSEKSSFPMREAYKSLRTNVLFSLPGSDSKCIGVVSANRGEGKSTVAINLAVSFAQVDKKVIVVDFSELLFFLSLNTTSAVSLSYFITVM